MIVTRKEAVDLIKDTMDTDIPLEGERLEKVVYAVNEDLQVRDWIMGLPTMYTLKESIDWAQQMVLKSTKEDSVPFVVVQATFCYEEGDVERAESLINYAHSINPNYPLAHLLTSVFKAKWSKDFFRNMRKEMHPKVEEACAEDVTIQVGS